MIRRALGLGSLVASGIKRGWCLNKGNSSFFHTTPRLYGLEEFFEGGQALPVIDLAAKPTMGRAWSANELRLKSFDDLHKLWFVILKELNLLATQKAEAARVGQRFFGQSRVRKCRVSMARIKTVLTERQALYERAAALVSSIDALTAAPREGQLLVDLQKKDKMQQLWRQRKFRQRINYRNRRSSLFV